ncbi:MAG: hypothetical protein IPF83_00050 [Rhodanobacteraceae bacterium]|nr:hypothetical protein [Rhodanobacteraceae bacterium]MBP9155860.1 hypothetical protein [Xanthomonadales bacterium]HQW82776.1 hypothetical protein [Pseudomonadota bacterium]
MKSLFFLAITVAFATSDLRAADAVAAPLQATLKEITGSVLVNQGEQFIELAPGTQLKPGDRVMSMEDSKALVRYFDDCEVEVKEGDVYTIDERLPCPCLNFKDEEDPVATLVESTGDLALRQYDESYAGIAAGQMLHVGDRVRIADEAKGMFEYRDGCREEVAESNDFEIPDQSPCLCAALIFDKVAPIQGSLVTEPGILIPTIIAACLAIDHDDDTFNCKDGQASP